VVFMILPQEFRARAEGPSGKRALQRKADPNRRKKHAQGRLARRRSADEGLPTLTWPESQEPAEAGFHAPSR